MESLEVLLGESQRTVIFTGAGISTESGIPDFRSPNGIWSKTTPIYYQDFVASEEARREAWRRKMIADREMREAEPNRGHRAVAELVSRDTVTSVITQNIDGLHQKSGVSDVKEYVCSISAATFSPPMMKALPPAEAVYSKASPAAP